MRGAVDEITVVQHPYQPQRIALGGSYYLSPYKQFSANNWKGMAVTLDGRSIGRASGFSLIRVLSFGIGKTMFIAQINGGWVVDRDTQGLFAPAEAIHAPSYRATSDGTVSVTLAGILNGAMYQRSLDGGATWTDCAVNDIVRLSAGQRVQWRGISGTARSGIVEARRS